MKSYNEMARSVFRRRNEYQLKQEYRRKKTKKIIFSFVCLIIIFSIGIWQSGILQTKPTINQNHVLVNKNITDNQDNKININQIDKIPTRKINSDLDKADFVSMTKSQLTNYYHTNVFPQVSIDLKEYKKNQYGVYKRNHGTGEVYWDVNTLNYFNKDLTKKITVEIKKGNLPWNDTNDFYSHYRKSYINEIEVGIGRTDSHIYLVEFMYNQVGFRMISEGLTQDELVSIISSLIS